MKLSLLFLVLTGLCAAAQSPVFTPFKVSQLGNGGAAAVAPSFSTPTFVSDILGPAAGAGTTYTITAPASVANNDIIIVKITLAVVKTITVPSGFALIQSVTNTAGSKPFVDYIFWKREDASPDASYAFSWTGSTFRWGWAGCFRGAITTGTPFDTHTPRGYIVYNDNIFAGSTITTTINNVLGIFLGGIYEDATGSTPPTGWTEIQDAGDTSGGVNMPMCVAIRDLTTAGSHECIEGVYATAAGSTTTAVIGLIPATAGTLNVNNIDQYSDWEDSTDGTTMTLTILKNCQFGDYQAPWQVRSGSSYTGMQIGATPFSGVYIPNFTNARVYLSSVGTRAYKFDHAASAGGDAARLRFGALGTSAIEGQVVSCTIYFLFQPNVVAPSSADINIDHVVINKASGGFSVFQQQFSTIKYAVRAHSSTGVSTFGADINVTAGHKYWVGLLNDAAGGNTVVNVYDAENGNALVGTSTAAMSTGSTVTEVFVGGGYIEATATGTTFYDNFAMRYSTTGWPMIAP